MWWRWIITYPERNRCEFVFVADGDRKSAFFLSLTSIEQEVLGVEASAVYQSQLGRKIAITSS